MPAKKKPVKKSVSPKRVIAKAKSQTEKKKSPPKLQMAKKPKNKPEKKSAPTHKASGGNIFWKVLEMRRRERDERMKAEQGQHDSKDPRHVYSDKHARFSRFAGPRRRAA